MKIKQEAADLDNLTLYMATSLSFTESFFMSRKRKTEFKKPTTGYCFPCESEFTRAGNFQTKDSDFALAIFKQRIPISGWFCNATVKTFFSRNSMK